MTAQDAPKPAPAAQLHLTGPLGEQISVSVTPKDLYPTLSRWGGKGFFSGEVPCGGFILPLENEHDFNWALIGGRAFEKDGEQCVYCRGHVYKRREFEAVESRKLTMPPAVKYSRGAKPTDPAHIREKSDGEIEYVSLAIFRGGRRNEAFALRP